MLATTLLSTVHMDFKMKKLNSEVKKTFYFAEAGLDEAYVLVLKFVDSAIKYAASEENMDSKTVFIDFIEGRYMNTDWKKGLGETLKDKGSYEICKDNDISIDVKLKKNKDSFSLTLTSHCKRDNIEKKIAMEYKIDIPDNSYLEKDQGDNFCPGDIYKTIKSEDIVQIVNWKVER